MKEDKIPTGIIVLIFCSLTFLFVHLLRSYFPKPVTEEREYSVKEYLEHPEYYEVKKIYEDSMFVGYKVEYKK